jgi:hypothetical protein
MPTVPVDIPGTHYEVRVESGLLANAGTIIRQLTYEPNTVLTQKKKLGQIIPMDEATELAMLHETRSRMADAGLAIYEISNLAYCPLYGRRIVGMQ